MKQGRLTACRKTSNDNQTETDGGCSNALKASGLKDVKTAVPPQLFLFYCLKNLLNKYKVVLLVSKHIKACWRCFDFSSFGRFSDNSWNKNTHTHTQKKQSGGRTVCKQLNMRRSRTKKKLLLFKKKKKLQNIQTLGACWI